MELVVVCAVSLKNDEVLITRRKKGKEMEGMWEFPGGKVNKNEKYESALKREILEELNVVCDVKSFICSNRYSMNGKTINLNAYYVEFETEPVISTDHDKIERVPIMKLSNYYFCPADLPIIEQIQNSGRA